MSEAQERVAVARAAIATAHEELQWRSRAVITTSAAVGFICETTAKNSYVQGQARRALDKLARVERILSSFASSLSACDLIMHSLDEQSQTDAIILMEVVAADLRDLDEVMTWLSIDLVEALDCVIQAGGGDPGNEFARAEGALRHAHLTMNDMHAALRDAHEKTCDAAKA